MPRGRPLKNTPEFIKAQAVIDPVSQCWVWPKNKDRDGYGRVCHKGKEQFVHRLSYSFWVGDLKSDRVIMHTCDNRACYNPQHLKQGTVSDNNKDCSIKGRKRTKESNPNAKLTEYQVKLIREFHELGMSQDEISKMFNISRVQVRNIIYYRMWD